MKDRARRVEIKMKITIAKSSGGNLIYFDLFLISIVVVLENIGGRLMTFFLESVDESLRKL